MPSLMDHNEFDFMDDLVKPFRDFVKRIDDGINGAENIPTEEGKQNNAES